MAGPMPAQSDESGNPSNPSSAVQAEDADLDSAIDALQAVVLTQKAQIDALLASLEGLLAALNSPTSPLGKGWAQPMMAQAMQKSVEHKPAPAEHTSLDISAQPAGPDAALLGNPSDPQFASMHQLMERLRLG
jgi:hypothetical protein